MDALHIVGFDPGLVHTGCIRLYFLPQQKTVYREFDVIVGPDAKAAKAWAFDKSNGTFTEDPYVFIEGYRPRSHFGQDQRMVNAVADFKRETTGNVINNTGVKKVVRKKLLSDVLGVWNSGVASNHQDVRSAAYIAVYGMLKDPEMNAVLTQATLDYIEGHPWSQL